MLVGIVGVDESAIQDRFGSTLQNALDSIEKVYNIRIFLGIGETYNSIKDTVKSYTEAVTALNYAILKNKGFTFFSKIKPDDNLDWNDFTEYQYKLENIIKAGDKDETTALLELLGDAIYKTSAFYNCYVKDLFMQIAIIPVHILIEHGYGIQDVIYDKYYIFDNLSYIETIEEFKTWFLSFAFLIMDYIKQNRDTPIRRDIEIIMEYINKNYCTNITLETLSREVMLTPSYISRLFKEGVKVSFIKYLTDLRMEKAKELLIDYRYKIYEVSYMVGYNNVKHFVTLFKKHTGITPKEYREKILV